MFKKLIKWLIGPFIRFNRYRYFLKTNKQLEKSYQVQLLERKRLRQNVNAFLYEYFGIDAISKYIPHDFKNKEEVKTAVVTKFSAEMDRLNVSYTDLFNG